MDLGAICLDTFSLSGVKVPSSGCSVSDDVLLLLPGGDGEDLEWVCGCGGARPPGLRGCVCSSTIFCFNFLNMATAAPEGPGEEGGAEGDTGSRPHCRSPPCGSGAGRPFPSPLSRRPGAHGGLGAGKRARNQPAPQRFPGSPTPAGEQRATAPARPTWN